MGQDLHDFFNADHLLLPLSVREQLAHEGNSTAMTGFGRDNACQYSLAGQREVAHTVKRFVTHKLVRPA